MDQKRASSAVAGAPAARTQYLTFLLGDEEYGVEILRVQEIKGYSAITPIPNAPAFVKGVMNLRGTVVPVLVLREMFGMAPTEYNKFSVIIVLSVGSKIVGILVDAVSEVLELDLSDIELAPELGARVDTSCISGMGRADDKFIIVLAIDKVVSGIDVVQELNEGAGDDHGANHLWASARAPVTEGVSRDG